MGHELAVVQSVIDSNLLGNVTFISFNHESIDRINVLGLGCNLGYLYEISGPQIDQVKGIQLVLPEHPLITQKLISDAHERRMEVITWALDDTAKAVELARMGLDGIITNDPESIKKALRQ